MYLLEFSFGQVVWRKLGDTPPDAAPEPLQASSESSSSIRPNAPPRHHSTSSYSSQGPPPRYGNIPAAVGGSQSRYMGSTNSLDRVDRKPP